jgi:hypothetical protein
VNPARSTGPALIVGGWALQQLWMFWVVPIIGGAIAGLAYPWLAAEEGRRVKQHAPERGAKAPRGLKSALQEIMPPRGSHGSYLLARRETQ